MSDRMMTTEDLIRRSVPYMQTLAWLRALRAIRSLPTARP